MFTDTTEKSLETLIVEWLRDQNLYAPIATANTAIISRRG